MQRKRGAGRVYHDERMPHLGRVVSAVSAIALLLIGCSGSSARDDSGRMPVLDPAPVLRTVELRLPAETIALEVADDPPERTRGLSERDALDPDSGMLFVWDDANTHQLWMKGMRFPLDFIWLDANKTVIEVHRDVPTQPGASDADLIRYAPADSSSYVIELNAGAAARLGVEQGDRLAFDEGTD